VCQSILLVPSVCSYSCFSGCDVNIAGTERVLIAHIYVSLDVMLLWCYFGATMVLIWGSIILLWCAYGVSMLLMPCLSLLPATRMYLCSYLCECAYVRDIKGIVTTHICVCVSECAFCVFLLRIKLPSLTFVATHTTYLEF
jgi:hypothetical protein